MLPEIDWGSKDYTVIIFSYYCWKFIFPPSPIISPPFVLNKGKKKVLKSDLNLLLNSFGPPWVSPPVAQRTFSRRESL